MEDTSATLIPGGQVGGEADCSYVGIDDLGEDLAFGASSPRLVGPVDAPMLAEVAHFETLMAQGASFASPLKTRGQSVERLKGTVGTAKYHAPTVAALNSVKKAASNLATPRIMHEQAALLSPGMFKTEMWREQGCVRWPNPALDGLRKQPTQFAKAEEVVPLQRTAENAQANIHSELWCRSLRTRNLGIQNVGLHNSNVATSAVTVMFNRNGDGWTGRTNAGGPRPRLGQSGPLVHDWIERPVAVGKVGLEHLNGSRYKMDSSPRTCVPQSMSHHPANSPRKRNNAIGGSPHNFGKTPHNYGMANSPRAANML